jgi:hypothetical protein
VEEKDAIGKSTYASAGYTQNIYAEKRQRRKEG